MDSFGNKFRITLFGESHGPAVGVVMDGVMPGITLSQDDFMADIDRRRSGAAGTTARRESDRPEILSGVYNGFTTGAPLTVVFRNEDTRPGDYGRFVRQPRPGHADWTARVRYNGFNDPRGGGHFSGRLTLPLVAAGVVAKKMLGDGVRICAEIIRVGMEFEKHLIDEVIREAAERGDTVGGCLKCTVDGFPAGRGEPFFDSVESVISHIVFSIPGIKGVDFGAGFSSSVRYGSDINDTIISTDGKTSTNNAGGINGGITNGNQIEMFVAVRPAASIAIEQQTMNMETGCIDPLTIEGRHDTCIALRMPVIVEAAVAIALVQF